MRSYEDVKLELHRLKVENKQLEAEEKRLEARLKEIQEYVRVSHPVMGQYGLSYRITALEQELKDMDLSKPVGWLKYPRVLTERGYVAGGIELKAGMVVRVTTDKADGYSVVKLKEHTTSHMSSEMGHQDTYYVRKLYFDHPDINFPSRVFLSQDMGIIPHKD